MRQPIALALLCAAAKAATDATNPHTLVLYAYSQHSAEAVANVRYFLRFGLSNATDATFVFVVNGCHSVQFPADRPNVLVVERPNTCFDFGAWGVGLEAAEAQRSSFTLSCAVAAAPAAPAPSAAAAAPPSPASRAVAAAAAST